MSVARFLQIASTAALLGACGGGGSAPSAVSMPATAAAPKAVAVNSSMASPWGLAFQPDGRMPVTRKSGSMVMLSADGAKVELTRRAGRSDVGPLRPSRRFQPRAHLVLTELRKDALRVAVDPPIPRLSSP